MSTLPPNTQRRLQKVVQVPNVWEGDRRPLVPGLGTNLETEEEKNGDCIIWVDGSEGMVRAMEVVSSDMGLEAMVRTLLRAIENPHSPAPPARPQKIVVRDREIQFFLRGALQNLEITVEYVPELPLIDELFRGFESLGTERPPALPPQYASLLENVATEIWDEAPWEYFQDHQILSITLNQWDIKKLYVSVMGMLGQEYGVLLYRSLESLKRFRAAVVTENNVEELEKAFLSQNCWFLNFDFEEEAESELGLFLPHFVPDEVQSLFGSVHPFEGMREFLDEEEALVVYMALKAFHKFVHNESEKFDVDVFPALSRNYKLPIPQQKGKKVAVKLETLPDLAEELLALSPHPSEDEEDSLSTLRVPIQDNLVPKDSLLSIGVIPWEWVDVLRNSPKKHYQSQGAEEKGEGLPMVLIQTSRPKGQVIIDNIVKAGGGESICFNPGEDPFSDTAYDLGILQTGNGDLYLFGEFIADDPNHLDALKKWERRCKKTKGYCALVIARGLKGASRGNPQLRDMMALFEAKSLPSQNLGMGILQLMPQFGFELD